MSNWLSGLRRFGLLSVIACAALIASSAVAHAQSFKITNVTTNSSSVASYPAMAVGSDGALNVVWIDSVKGLQFARSTSSAANGTALGTPVTIAGPTNGLALPAFQPQIAVYMTKANIIEIVWAAVDPTSPSTAPLYDVFASRSEQSGAAGTFVSTKVGGPVALFDSPRLAFDFSGNTNIVWGQHDVLITQAQDGLHFPPAVSLLPVSPATPTTPPDTGGPRIAVSVDNHIFVAWTDEQARNAAGSYCTTPTKDPTGAFFTNIVGGYFWMNETAPVAGAFNFIGTNTRNLSNTDWFNGGGLDSRYPNGFFGCSYDNLRMFTDQTGQVDLLWSGDDQDILISQHHGKGSIGMSFSFPINLANLDASSPDVAVDNAGNLYIVWSGGPGPGANAQGIFFRRFDVTSGQYGPQLSIAPANSPGSAFPQIATDSNSNVNIAWEQPTAAITNGSNVFNVFFARSTDGGNTFSSAVQVTTNPSVLCFKPGPFFQGPGVPTTPDFTTCGTVQLGVDANATPDMVWVNQASVSAVADIDFATSTSPTGTISPSSANLTATNASANFTVTVNGFSSPITFSCLDADKNNAPLPSWLACSFKPQPLDPTQSNTDTLTISRQGTPTSAVFISAPLSHNGPAYGGSMAMALATISLMAMLMLAMGRRRDLGRALVLRGFLVMTLTVVLAAGLVSCGGSTSSSSGTTASGGTTSGTGTGGTGTGSTPITVHVAVQAQSGTTTTILGTVTITAQ